MGTSYSVLGSANALPHVELHEHSNRFDLSVAWPGESVYGPEDLTVEQVASMACAMLKILSYWTMPNQQAAIRVQVTEVLKEYRE